MTDIKDPTQTVHQAFAELAQEVFEQYGVKIEGVDFQWLDRMDGKSILISTNVDSNKLA